MKREGPFPSRPSCRRASFAELLSLIHWPTVGGAAAVAVLLLAVLIGLMLRPLRPRMDPMLALAAMETASTARPVPCLLEPPPRPLSDGANVEKEARPARGPGVAAADVQARDEEEACAEECKEPAAAPAEGQPAAAPVEPEIPVQPAPAGVRPGRPRSFGTALTFAVSPRDAGRQAARQRKLVFLLHVSGDFEKSEFT